MSKFASRLLTTSCMFAPTTQIDPVILIDHICKESDHLAMQRKREKSAKGQGQQGGAQNEVLAATGKGGRCKCKGKCHNCSKPGHWARECQSQKKDNQQSGQSSSTPNASTSQTQARQQSQQGS
jgi:hypothetical protein